MDDRLRILYLEEFTQGGGAKANESLALAASAYARVYLFTQNPDRDSLDGITVIRIARQSRMSAAYAWHLREALGRVDPDIVHATGMFSGVVALWLRWLGRYRFKVVTTLHHTGTVFRWHAISRHLVRMLNHCDVVHYLTDYQCRLYARFGLSPPPDRVLILPNIVPRQPTDPDEVRSLRHRLGEASEARHLIVYAGRLVPTKRIDLFIATIAELRGRGHDVGGVICGAGDAAGMAALRRLADEQGVSRHVVWAGHVVDVSNYLRACDFGLFPTETEAQPLFVIESFAQRKTLVASNAECLAGIVVDGVDGVITSQHSVEGYVSACERLLADASFLRQLEEGATRAYGSRYEPLAVADRYRSLYSRLTCGAREWPRPLRGGLEQSATTVETCSARNPRDFPRHPGRRAE